jgi:photosystem II stability/assembly factor-like uncharacterized protein
MSMAPDDRERNFEKALARNLRSNISGEAPSPGAGCPDAEILAAYHERLLAPEEMIFRKQHISDCPRCQEILAQLEATDEIPVEPTDVVKDEELASQSVFATGSFEVRGVRDSSSPSGYEEAVPKTALPLEMPRPAANWRWLAPAGALAAILLVWVAAHERTSPSMQVAKHQPPPNPVGSQSVPAAPAAASKDESALHELRAPSLTKDSASTQADALKRREPEHLDQQKMSHAPVDQAVSSLRDAAVGGAAVPPKPAPARVLTVPQLEKKQLGGRESDTQQRSSSVSAVSDPANSGVPYVSPTPPAAEAKKAADSFAATTPASQPSRQSAGDITNLPAVDEANKVANRIVDIRNLSWLAKISAPDGASLWRAGEYGIIQHSTDSGATWTIQASGVVADLTAGSASSINICWLVGRNGAILRTIDAGNHWQKLSSPTTDDIISVFAVNAQQATVTTAANKTYKTTDAGVTWAPLRNP